MFERILSKKIVSIINSELSTILNRTDKGNSLTIFLSSVRSQLNKELGGNIFTLRNIKGQIKYLTKIFPQMSTNNCVDLRRLLKDSYELFFLSSIKDQEIREKVDSEIDRMLAEQDFLSGLQAEIEKISEPEVSRFQPKRNVTGEKGRVSGSQVMGDIEGFVEAGNGWKAEALSWGAELSEGEYDEYKQLIANIEEEDMLFAYLLNQNGTRNNSRILSDLLIHIAKGNIDAINTGVKLVLAGKLDVQDMQEVLGALKAQIAAGDNVAINVGVKLVLEGKDTQGEIFGALKAQILVENSHAIAAGIKLVLGDKLNIQEISEAIIAQIAKGVADIIGEGNELILKGKDPDGKIFGAIKALIIAKANFHSINAGTKLVLEGKDPMGEIKGAIQNLAAIGHSIHAGVELVLADKLGIEVILEEIKAQIIKKVPDALVAGKELVLGSKLDIQEIVGEIKKLILAGNSHAIVAGKELVLGGKLDIQEILGELKTQILAGKWEAIEAGKELILGGKLNIQEVLGALKAQIAKGDNAAINAGVKLVLEGKDTQGEIFGALKAQIAKGDNSVIKAGFMLLGGKLDVQELLGELKNQIAVGNWQAIEAGKELVLGGKLDIQEMREILEEIKIKAAAGDWYSINAGKELVLKDKLTIADIGIAARILNAASTMEEYTQLVEKLGFVKLLDSISSGAADKLYQTSVAEVLESSAKQLHARIKVSGNKLIIDDYHEILLGTEMAHKLAEASDPVKALPFVVTDQSLERLKAISDLDQLGKPGLFVGNSGEGKTAAIKWYCQLTGREEQYRRINLSRQTDSMDLIGGVKPVPRVDMDKVAEGDEPSVKMYFEWIDGILVDAAKKGHILVLDELNLAPAAVLGRLNQLTDDEGRLNVYERAGDSEIEIGAGFRMFGTMNYHSDAGRNKLDDAIMNRFVTINVPDMSAEDISAIVRGRNELPDDMAIKLGKFQYKLGELARARELGQDNREAYVFTIRDALRCAGRYEEYVRGGASESNAMGNALQEAYADGLKTETDRKQFWEQVRAQFGKGIEKPEEGIVTEAGLRELIIGHPGIQGDGKNIPGEWAALEGVPTTCKYGKKILDSLIRNEAVMLEGLTAAAKSSIVGYLARLSGNKLDRFTINENLDVDDLIGTYRHMEDGSVRFVEGILLQAMLRGEWLFLDEVNLGKPEILDRIFSLLDDDRNIVVTENGERRVLVPHDKFRLIVAMNPASYSGRKKLSPAFINRYRRIWVEDDMPDEEVRTILRGKDNSVNKELIDAALDIYRSSQAIMSGASQNKLFTLRDIKLLMKYVAQFSERMGQREALGRGYQLIFANKVKEEAVREKLVTEAEKIISELVEKERVIGAQGRVAVARVAGDMEGFVEAGKEWKAEVLSWGAELSEAEYDEYKLLIKNIKDKDMLLAYLLNQNATLNNSRILSDLLVSIAAENRTAINSGVKLVLGGKLDIQEMQEIVGAIKQQIAAGYKSAIEAGLKLALVGKDSRGEILGELKAQIAAGNWEAIEAGGELVLGGKLEIKEILGELKAQIAAGNWEAIEAGGELVLGGKLEIKEILGELKAQIAAGSREAIEAVSGLVLGGKLEIKDIQEIEGAIKAHIAAGNQYVIEVGSELVLCGKLGTQDILEELKTQITAGNWQAIKAVVKLVLAGKLGIQEILEQMIFKIAAGNGKTIEAGIELVLGGKLDIQKIVEEVKAHIAAGNIFAIKAGFILLASKLDNQQKQVMLAELKTKIAVGNWQAIEAGKELVLGGKLDIQEMREILEEIKIKAAAGDWYSISAGKELVLKDKLTIADIGIAARILNAANTMEEYTQLVEKLGFEGVLGNVSFEAADKLYETSAAELLESSAKQLHARIKVSGNKLIIDDYHEILLGTEMAHKLAETSDPVKALPFVVTDQSLERLKAISDLDQLGKPGLFVGNSGEGKTAAIKWYCELTGREEQYRRINLSRQTDSMDLIGGVKPVPRVDMDKVKDGDETSVKMYFEWIDGILVDAAKKGHILVLDELNLAPAAVLGRLNQLTDDEGRLNVYERAGDSEIEIGAGFRMFGTMNYHSDAGRNKLDDAIMNRFVTINVPDMSAEDIAAVVRGRHELPDDLAIKLGKFQYKLGELARARELGQDNREAYVFTVRDALRCAGRYEEYVSSGTSENDSMGLALQEAYADGLKTETDRKQFWEQVEAQFGKGIEKPEEGIVTEAGLRELIAGHPGIQGDGKNIPGEWAALEGVPTTCKYGKKILDSLLRNEAVMLEGLTAAAKSSIVGYLARLSGNKLDRFTINENLDVDDLIGTYRHMEDGSVRFVEGILLQAMLKGEWLFLDEVNLGKPEILDRIFSLLDDDRNIVVTENGQRRVLVPHDKFRLIVAMNPASYAGRKKLSPAFINRYRRIWVEDDMSDEEVRTILAGKASVNKELIDAALDIYRSSQAIMSGASQNKLFTLRDIKLLMKYVAQFGGRMGQREALGRGYQLIFANKVKDEAVREELVNDADTIISELAETKIVTGAQGRVAVARVIGDIEGFIQSGSEWKSEALSWGVELSEREYEEYKQLICNIEDQGKLQSYLLGYNDNHNNSRMVSELLAQIDKGTRYAIYVGKELVLAGKDTDGKIVRAIIAKIVAINSTVAIKSDVIEAGKELVLAGKDIRGEILGVIITKIQDGNGDAIRVGKELVLEGKDTNGEIVRAIISQIGKGTRHAIRVGKELVLGGKDTQGEIVGAIISQIVAGNSEALSEAKELELVGKDTQGALLGAIEARIEKRDWDPIEAVVKFMLECKIKKSPLKVIMSKIAESDSDSIKAGVMMVLAGKDTQGEIVGAIISQIVAGNSEALAEAKELVLAGKDIQGEILGVILAKIQVGSCDAIRAGKELVLAGKDSQGEILGAIIAQIAVRNGGSAIDAGKELVLAGKDTEGMIFRAIKAELYAPSGYVIMAAADLVIKDKLDIEDIKKALLAQMEAGESYARDVGRKLLLAGKLDVQDIKKTLFTKIAAGEWYSIKMGKELVLAGKDTQGEILRAILAQIEARYNSVINSDAINIAKELVLGDKLTITDASIATRILNAASMLEEYTQLVEKLGFEGVLDKVSFEAADKLYQTSAAELLESSAKQLHARIKVSGNKLIIDDYHEILLGEEMARKLAEASDPVKALPFVVTDQSLARLKAISDLDQLGKAGLFVGNSGEGKTAAIKWYCELTGREEQYRRINLSRQTDSMDLIGGVKPVPRADMDKVAEGDEPSVKIYFEWIDGILVDAAKKGHILVLDELNLAPAAVLGRLNQLTDDEGRLNVYERAGDSEIEIGAGFRMFGTMNYHSDAGRNKLDDAIMNRFVTINVPDMSAEDISAIVQGRNELPGDMAIKLGKFQYKLGELARARELGQDNREAYVFTVRDALRCAGRYEEYVRGGASESNAMGNALQEAYADGLKTETDRKQFWEQVRAQFGKGIEKPEEGIETEAGLRELIAGNPGIQGDGRNIPGEWAALEGVPTTCKYGKKILDSLIRNEAVMLEGLTAAAKSSIVGYLARLSGNKLDRFTINENLDVDDLIGTYRHMEDGSVRFVEGILLQAMLKGEWLFLDEVNLGKPEILDRIFSLLDDDGNIVVTENGQRRVLVPHDKFRLIVAMNPASYAGRKKLSPAFINRYRRIWVEDDMPDEEVRTIVRKELGVINSAGHKIDIAPVNIMTTEPQGEMNELVLPGSIPLPKSIRRTNMVQPENTIKMSEVDYGKINKFLLDKQMDEVQVGAELERLKQLNSKLVYLAKLSGNNTVQLEIGEQNCHYSERNVIELNKDDFIKHSDDELLGIIFHEGGHSELTRCFDMEFYEDKLKHLLFNVIEDGRVNLRQIDRFAGAKDYLSKRHARIYARPQIPEKIESAKRLPLFQQFTNEVLIYWLAYKGNSGAAYNAPDYVDKRVADSLAKVLPAIKEAWEARPTEFEPSEKVKRQYGVKELQIIKEKILDEYLNLVKQDNEDAIEQFKKDNLGGKFGKGQPSSGNPLSITPEEYDKLPDDVKKELNDMASGQGQDLGKEAQDILKGIIDGKIERIAKSESGKLEGMFDRPDKSYMDKKMSDLDKLSQDSEPVSSADKKMTVEDMLKSARNRRKITEINDINNPFTKYFRRVSSLANDILGRLESVFVMNDSPSYTFPHMSGSKISSKHLLRYYTSQGTFLKIFKKKTMPEKRDYRFAFVLDESGSMDGHKESVMEMMAIFMHVLGELGIKYSVVGFSDRAVVHKEFEEEHEDLKTKNRFISDVESYYYNGGGSNDSEGLATGIETIRTAGTADENIVIVLTDGEGNVSGGKSLEQLQKEAAKEGITVIGIGIGEGIQSVEKHYKHYVQERNIDALPGCLGRLLEKLIIDGIN